MILSPITGKPAKKIKSIETSTIIEKYNKTFNLDVSKYFKNYKSCEIYQCEQTGYQFYYPFDIDGDSKFYEHLQQYDWYYMPWKWEHQQAAKLLKPYMNVLEVGCAKGDFLKKIKNDFKVNVIGLELNESVSNNEITILKETIQEHSINNPEKYDIVCSFQVLEHITDVKSFIEAQIATLKKGGKLIIIVPNNDSFIKYSDNILNMPPHHMGLWNKSSLTNLQSYFNIKLLKTIFEPLQKYHIDYFNNTTLKYIRKTYKIPIRILNKLKNSIQVLSFKKYKSFSIIAVFEKI